MSFKTEINIFYENNFFQKPQNNRTLGSLLQRRLLYLPWGSLLLSIFREIQLPKRKNKNHVPDELVLVI